MEQITISVYAKSENKIFPFHFNIHEVSAPEGLLIEDEFYTGHKVELPTGKHYEVEILSQDVLEHPHVSKIRLHRSSRLGQENRVFVCYLAQLENTEKVMKMLRIWCAGTTYTMITGKGFSELYTSGEEKFFATLKELYGIDISTK